MTKGKVRNLIATEAEEQMALIKWANINRIPLVHIPNESPRNPLYGKKLLRLGLCRGFPDLFLPKGYGGFFGMFIEMKQKREYRKSEMKTNSWKLQEAWVDKLNRERYYATFAFGWDEARKLIEKYLQSSLTLKFEDSAN